MMTIRYKGDTLKIGDNAITFGAPIEKVLEIQNKILVLVQDESSRVNRKHGNIFAFDDKGKKLWEIEAPDKYEGWYRPFTGIYLRKNMPIAYSPVGIEYKIDLSNGKLIKVLGQRPW